MNANSDSAIWFHVTLTTYGSWLPGDSRGFRTRNHREHIEGDYRNPPPPGKYEGLYRSSQRAMKSDPVCFSPEHLPVVCLLIRERLLSVETLPAAIAVAGQHSHLLFKDDRELVDQHVEFVKRHVTFSLKGQGWTGPVWAAGKHVKRIRERTHQLRAFHYILRHQSEGAAVWSCRDES